MILRAPSEIAAKGRYFASIYNYIYVCVTCATMHCIHS